MIDENIIKDAIGAMASGFEKEKAYFSITRDVFTARLESFISDTKKYLEAAIIGEIGNNTFDHNFIFENINRKGVYCNYNFQKKYVVLADYGRGIKESLRQVVVSIQNDLEALEIAFTKKISGRSPEQRGNGLKFVSETIQNSNWDLYFHSGNGCCFINKDGIKYLNRGIVVSGCLAIIDFHGGN
jgi:hypothetical protein